MVSPGRSCLVVSSPDNGDKNLPLGNAGNCGIRDSPLENPKGWDWTKPGRDCKMIDVHDSISCARWVCWGLRPTGHQFLNATP